MKYAISLAKIILLKPTISFALYCHIMYFLDQNMQVITMYSNCNNNFFLTVRMFLSNTHKLMFKKFTEIW